MPLPGLSRVSCGPQFVVEKRSLIGGVFREVFFVEREEHGPATTSVPCPFRTGTPESANAHAAMARFSNGPRGLLFKRLTNLILMHGQCSDRPVLTFGVRQGPQAPDAIRLDIPLHGRTGARENLRHLFTFQTRVQQPDRPQSASHARVRMWLTHSQHDPLFVFGQLDPQPTHASPPFALARTLVAILTASRSVTENHQQGNRSFQAACGINKSRHNVAVGYRSPPSCVFHTVHGQS